MRAIAALAPAVALAAAALSAGAAPAGPRATAALIAGWSEKDGHVAGLAIDLAPGWKTYWRAPGLAGIPPVFDWSASRNVAAVTVEWPRPRAFDSFGMTTIGYSDEVTLPLRVTPGDPDEPVALRLTLDYGVCADICVPERATLSLSLDPDAPATGAVRIAAAQADAPDGPEAWGVAAVSCALTGAGDARGYAATLTFADAAPDDVIAVVEGPEGLWFEAASVVTTGSALTVTAQAQASGAAPWTPRDALRLTLLDGERAMELRGCPPGR